MWNYFPMLFDDFALLYIVNENNDGSRTTEEAVRIWKDPAREVEWLGRPEHDQCSSTPPRSRRAYVKA